MSGEQTNNSNTELSKHSGHRNRLRDRFIAAGASKLSGFEAHEILELLLFYVMPRVNTNEIAHDLINTFGSLHAVFEADIHSLKQVHGIGEQSALFLHLMSGVFDEYAKSKVSIRNVIITSANVGEYVKPLFLAHIYEVFYIISLDAKNRVITYDLVCHGSMDSVGIKLRDIVSTVLRSNATSVILAHNHPGGRPVPSDADKRITRIIKQILHSIDVRVVDHIIVAGNEYTSMASDLHLI